MCHEPPKICGVLGLGLRVQCLGFRVYGFVLCALSAGAVPPRRSRKAPLSCPSIPRARSRGEAVKRDLEVDGGSE